MGDLLTIQVEGLSQLIKRVNEMPAKIGKEVDGELMFAGQEIINRAARSAPVNTGRLRQGIGPTPIKLGELSYEVSSNVHYSPYVEFGTGNLVQIPEGLEEYASQFRGKGIRKINRAPKPFFFPQFFFVKVDLLKNIKNILANP